MYYYIEGKLVLIGDLFAVVECNGVGYKIGTSRTALSKLSIGNNVKFFTILNVREDAMELYGFPTEEEKKLFLMLTDISGVGPKAAISILSVSTADKIALSIMTGDEKTITAASGIGKKIAQRIILELRDKISKQIDSEPLQTVPGEIIMPSVPQARSGAVSALMVLGYSRQEAMAAVGSVPDEITAMEEIVKIALKNT